MQSINKTIDTITGENNFNNLDSWLEYSYSMADMLAINQSKINDISNDTKTYYLMFVLSISVWDMLYMYEYIKTCN